MILVDTNVILDVINRDPKWFHWSRDKIRETREENELYINVVIYTELVPAYQEEAELQKFIRRSPFQKRVLPFSSAAPTARAFLDYRKRGGKKNSPLPDFFIGGHAEAEGLAILTRDENRYQTYFPNVKLICPSGRCS